MTSYPSTSAQEVTFPTLESSGCVKPVLSKSQRLCEIYKTIDANGELDNLSAREVAKKYDISKTTVLKWYHEKPRGWEKYLSIKDGSKRTVAQKILAHGGIGVTPVQQMAKEINVHEATLYRYMRQNGIKVPGVIIPKFIPTKLTFVESMMMKWR